MRTVYREPSSTVRQVPWSRETTTTAARWALGVWLVAVAIIVFQPRPAIATGTVHDLSAGLIALGFPVVIADPAHMEAILNAGMFLPAAALALLSWPRLRWADVVVVGFVASLSVEVVQYFFLSARTAETLDIVANTSGSLAGALIGEFVRSRAGRRTP